MRKTFDTECLEILKAAACQKPLSNTIVSLSRSLTSPHLEISDQDPRKKFRGSRNSILDPRISKLEPRNSILDSRKHRGSQIEFPGETVNLHLHGTVHIISYQTIFASWDNELTPWIW